MGFHTLCSLLLSTSLAAAARLTVSINSSAVLQNPSALLPSTHAILLGPPGIRYDVPIRRDNTFYFPEISAGSHLLTIHSRDYLFNPLRVDVSKSAIETEDQRIEVWQTFRGNEWSNKGPQTGSGNNDLAITVRCAGQKDFYIERGGFDILGFLKSPMILMALVSVVMIFGLPYLMENMDEETKAEFDEMQRKGPISGTDGAATQLQNFDLAGWMAGKTSSSGSGSASSSSAAAGGNNSRKR